MILVYSHLTDEELKFKFSNGLVHCRRVDLMPVKNLDPSTEGWEQLCTKCGDCCNFRWVGLDNKVNLTDHYCKYFDTHSRLCSVYDYRETVPGGCSRMSPNRLPAGMPESCIYVKLGYG